MSNPELPQWVERLIASGWVPSPGEVIEVFVFHDDDCPALTGGECACDPDVELVQPPGGTNEHRYPN